MNSETGINTDKKSRIMWTAVFVMLLFPFFQIDYFVDTISWAGKAYTLLQLLAGAAVVLLILRGRMLRKIPFLFLLFSGLLLVMIIAAGVNGGNVKRSLEYAFATLMLCLVIEYGIQRNIRALLSAGVWFFGALTVINLITIFVFRHGMYRYLDYYGENWFLGFKSGHIPYHMAFLFFSVMYVLLCDRKKWFLVRAAVGLVFVSDFVVRNRTAILVLLPLIILIFIPQILKFTKVMNILTYAGAAVVMDLLFVVFRKQELFQWLIVGIFHRRMDLTYRTDVWDAAFQAIREHLVIGHGYSTFEYSPVIVTTHNEVLEILYKTGMIGLILSLTIVVLVVIRLFRNRKLETAQWISVFLGAFFLMFVMEQYAFAYFFYLLIFAWHCADLTSFAQEQEKRRADPAVPSEEGRTGKSARNFVFTLFASLTAILIGLIAQRVFVHLLGLEYAGLNGLFSNVITMLGIADLGIGEAVVFHLYRPLEKGDTETVKSLMRFYRKAFHTVAGVIAVAGICLIPALPYLAKPTEADVNLTVIYLIFLADVVFSYFLSYKRAILYADQKNYIISTIHMIYLLSMNTGQLVMLYITHNYYAYLLIKVVFRILENVVITAKANQMYPYLKERDVRPLSKEIRLDIRKKVGALFFHKIGTFAVNGTDNILISVFLGLTTAGLYNNYFLVIDAAAKLFGPALTALTPSVGNMLVENEPEHWFQVFRRIRFMSFWIATCAATALLVLIQPFIRIWFGEKYLLTSAVVILLSFQFFQTLMRNSFSVFQDAAGIFYENRFVPLAESAINLGASLVLMRFFGLAGVFAGTIISSLALWGFSYPKFVYTKLFRRSVWNYIAETGGYLAVFLAIAGCSALIIRFVNNRFSAVGITQLFLNGILVLLLTNVLLAGIFFRSDTFKHFAGLLKKAL